VDAVFGPAEMVYSVDEPHDVDRFANLVEGMQLLEDDYLGARRRAVRARWPSGKLQSTRAPAELIASDGTMGMRGSGSRTSRRSMPR
jgi:hypothetical protein